MKEIKGLIIYLNKHRDNYYNHNPTISDAKYDKRYDKLEQLEKETGIIYSNSPTRSVGFIVKSELDKVEHSIPLLSLAKTKDIDELYKFIKKGDCLFQWKLDGLTNELIYNDGKLIQASTRGNGATGEDITHNAKTYQNIPLEIPYQGFLKLSGEAIMKNNDFTEINKLYDNKYKNPRNLCSGTVRQLDSEVCNSRKINFYAFSILECNKVFKLKNEQLDFITDQGFNTIQWYGIAPSDTNIKEVIDELVTRAEDEELNIDGLVMTYNDIEFSKKQGKTSHHPSDSIAFKFKDETEITTLREIEWSLGKTGKITPVAIFDVVELEGTEVSRASVHNLTILEELKLGIGDEIEVYKANQIIPQLLENHTRSNSVIIPIKCPVCGGIVDTETSETCSTLVCNNSNCSGKLLKKLAHFASKNAMDIDGLSEATIEKLMDKGIISSMSDIYELYLHEEEIISMDGFGVRSYNKLINSIEKSRDIAMNRFLYSLNIDLIGKTASRKIAEHFKHKWNDFIYAFDEDFDFSTLEDFGGKANESLYKWYNKEDTNRSLMDMATLMDKISFIIPQVKTVENNNTYFSNKKIYATGSFNDYSKKELKEIIENNGGIFANGYAKSLDLLIIGDKKGSSKVDKAIKDGIEVMSESKFKEIVNE